MNVVIIGAGQTGRGFVAPIMKNNNFELTFVDKDKKLINRLNDEGKYQVNYYEKSMEPIIIDDYKAYHIDDEKILKIIANADIVTTSVFASQIENLVPLLSKALSIRQRENKLIIMCLENGVNVKEPFIQEKLNAYITEGVIFCTSVAAENSLSITSQSGLDLPIDGSVGFGNLQITGMPLEMNFPDLIKRKIYTYNFISAVISYLGSYKKYEVISEAANDEDIKFVINNVVSELDMLIAKEFGLILADQKIFSQQAIDKFQNKEIFDSIYRNIRHAKRKLGENERMLTPLKMAIKEGADVKYFSLIVAAALFYAGNEEGLDVDEMIKSFENNIEIKDAVPVINQYYNSLVEGKKLQEITK